MDALGKEYLTDAAIEPLTTNVAYLKLINVPTMFDVGCSVSDPSSEYLTLNMIDDKSYKVERSDFLSRGRKFKTEKIEKFQSALRAIHTNLQVSETTIYPYGVVRNEHALQRGMFSNVVKSMLGGGGSGST